MVNIKLNLSEGSTARPWVFEPRPWTTVIFHIVTAATVPIWHLYSKRKAEISITLYRMSFNGCVWFNTIFHKWYRVALFHLEPRTSHLRLSNVTHDYRTGKIAKVEPRHVILLCLIPLKYRRTSRNIGIGWMEFVNLQFINWPLTWKRWTLELGHRDRQQPMRHKLVHSHNTSLSQCSWCMGYLVEGCISGIFSFYHCPHLLPAPPSPQSACTQ